MTSKLLPVVQASAAIWVISVSARRRHWMRWYVTSRVTEAQGWPVLR